MNLTKTHVPKGLSNVNLLKKLFKSRTRLGCGSSNVYDLACGTAPRTYCKTCAIRGGEHGVSLQDLVDIKMITKKDALDITLAIS